MTWNLYLGAPINYTVTDLMAIPFMVEEFWRNVQVTNFPARAKSIVRIIEKYKPDIIAFQEAVKYYIQQPGDFFGVNTPATDGVLDFVKVLKDLLHKRGMGYADYITNTATDIELPSAGGYDLRILDRQVIMVKNDQNPSMKLLNTGNGVFKARLSFPVAGLPFHIVRGWAFTDLLFGNTKIRIVTAHLEPASKEIGFQQALELIAGPCHTTLPLIVTGDFNAEPLATSPGVYRELIQNGFNDVWSVVGRGEGYTCCQESNLHNICSNLTRRIDWILFKGNFKVWSASTVGDKCADRVLGSPGLWPSDHAGLIADFTLN